MQENLSFTKKTIMFYSTIYLFSQKEEKEKRKRKKGGGHKALNKRSNDCKKLMVNF